MSTTKGDTIARARKLVKGESTEALLSNRFLYSMVLKFAKLYIKRIDDSNKLGRISTLYDLLPGVELIEVSKIEACVDIDLCCTFRRTKNKLPPILEGTYGPKIRSVQSIDGSVQVRETYAKIFSEMAKSSTFKYNKNKYFWIQNDYLYFPNIEWDVLDIDAMWEDNIDQYKCCAEDCCVNRLDELTHIPDYIFAEIENNVRQELLTLTQIPKDTTIDNVNTLR